MTHDFQCSAARAGDAIGNAPGVARKGSLTVRANRERIVAAAIAGRPAELIDLRSAAEVVEPHHSGLRIPRILAGADHPILLCVAEHAGRRPGLTALYRNR